MNPLTRDTVDRVSTLPLLSRLVISDALSAQKLSANAPNGPARSARMDAITRLWIRYRFSGILSGDLPPVCFSRVEIVG